MRTVGYAGLFVIGATMARHLAALRRKIEPHGWKATAALLCLSVFLFKTTRLLPARYYLWGTLVPLHGSGAALMMSLAMTTVWFRRFLRLEPEKWLGKVSYSLYLIHCIVLYSLVCLFWKHTTHHFLLCAFGILGSLGIADLMYEWVERPAIALGRKLTRRDTPLAPAANLPA